MPIITKRFRARYSGPHSRGDLIWEFHPKVAPLKRQITFELWFDKKRRMFFGSQLDPYRRRPLTEPNVAKLRAMLSPADIAKCTAATIGI